MDEPETTAVRGVTPGSVALVWVGGAGGTALRHLLSLAGPPRAELLVILAVNAVGALALGWLTARLGPATGSGRRRTLRVLVGTGFLGGFTTYSALAVGTVLLTRGAAPGWAVAYGLGSVGLGLVAAAAGHRWGRVAS